MEEKFTIEEIKKYISTQDSIGDVMYFLTPENIKNANIKNNCTVCNKYYDGFCVIDGELLKSNDHCESFTKIK